MSVVWNAIGVPALLADGAGGAAVVDLGTLTVGQTYIVTLRNARITDRDVGAKDWQVIKGWFKLAAAADCAAEAGEPLYVDTPREVVAVTGKTRLSFIRNGDTPRAAKVFVVLVSS